MIYPSPTGVSANYELTINGAEVKYDSISNISIALEEDKHDVLMLDMFGIPARAVSDYLNNAVQCRVWLAANYVHTFVGSIIEIQPHAVTSDGLLNDSPFQQSTIICMGASYEMRGPRDRSWETTSLHDVAFEFAKRYDFSVDVPNDEVVYDSLIQVNESDWQFLVRYANMMGYKTTCHGTHLHLYDPFKASVRSTSAHRLSTAPTDGFDMRSAPGQIMSFDMSVEDKRKSGQINIPIVSVINDDGTVFDLSSRDLNRQNGTSRDRDAREHVFADTYAKAQRALMAAQRRYYDYEATAVVSGVPGALPGGVALLDGYRNDFDGMWYVCGVTHTLVNQMFMSELSLRRNRNNQLDEYRPVTRYAEPPSPEWEGSYWRSSKRYLNAYV